MNWGKGIIIAYVLFALFIGALVTICIKQDVPLVTKNYYEEEINYQQQLDRKVNAGLLTSLPEISIVDNQFLEVRFDVRQELTAGEIKLFRPSDASLDQVFAFSEVNQMVQRFPLQHLAGGLYKAKMNWVMNGKEYYMEKVIVL